MKDRIDEARERSGVPAENGVRRARQLAGHLCRALYQIAHSPGLSDEEHVDVANCHMQAFYILGTLCGVDEATAALAAARQRIEFVPDAATMDTDMDLFQAACEALDPASDRHSPEETP